MELWLWSLYILPVSGALRFLPEVKLEGILGGSITIECPLPETHMRIYLCRKMTDSRICATVVSNQNFVKKEYKRRVTLKSCPNKKVYLVEVTNLAKSDSGIYACGAGRKTDQGRTQQVILNVHSEYPPFSEKEPNTEPPQRFHEFQHMPKAPGVQMPAHSISSKFISKVTTPALRTKFPPASSPSSVITTTHHLRVSRASSAAGANPPTLLPSNKALKKPQTTSDIHQPRQRAFHYGQKSGTEIPRLHILIPTTLSLILLALLGLVLRRVIQRRKPAVAPAGLGRRVSRQAVRTRVPESSRQPRPHGPRASQRPRAQNIYSACPRRARGADSAVPLEVPLPGPGALAPPTPPQVSSAVYLIDNRGRNGRPKTLVSVTSWFHAPSLKTSNEYVSIYHQPASKVVNTDPDDYVNFPC